MLHFLIRIFQRSPSNTDDILQPLFTNLKVALCLTKLAVQKHKLDQQQIMLRNLSMVSVEAPVARF